MGKEVMELIVAVGSAGDNALPGETIGTDCHRAKIVVTYPVGKPNEGLLDQLAHCIIEETILEVFPMSFAIAAEPVPLRQDERGIYRVGSTRVTFDTVIAAFKEWATVEESC